MTRAEIRVAMLAITVWTVASIGVGWHTLRGIDYAARSRDALARAHAMQGRAPTPAFPINLDASELAAVQKEERPLVVDDPDGSEIVTAAVKDADDWDIIGAVGLYSRWRERALATAWPAVAALLIGVGMFAGVRAVRDASPRAAALGGLGLFGTAAAATAAQLQASVPVLASHAELPASLSRLALPPPSLAFATLLLVCLAVGGALALSAVHWHAAAAGRPARVQETLGAWAFIAPSLLHLAVFTIAPIGFLFWISVHDWDLLATDRPFVGLAHFREIGADPLFWRALRNGLVYALYVPVTMIAALAAAIVLDQPLRGIKLLRVIVFLPFVASTVAIALVWQWLLHRDFGLLNVALAAMHLPRVDWLGSPATALPALMLVSAWSQLGYMMVIYLAGLQAIPTSLLEAARLDGASAWQRFRLIRWPLLRPVSTYLLLTGIIWSFHGFTLVYVMTEGGPAHATDVLVYRIFQTAWEFRRFDVAAAMSVVLCAVLLALTALQWRTVKGEAADV